MNKFAVILSKKIRTFAESANSFCFNDKTENYEFDSIEEANACKIKLEGIPSNCDNKYTVIKFSYV